MSIMGLGLIKCMLKSKVLLGYTMLKVCNIDGCKDGLDIQIKIGHPLAQNGTKWGCARPILCKG